MQITLQSGQFGWDFVLAADDGRTVYIQSDSDREGVARSFGWAGNGEVVEFLAEHVGQSIDDPGYFCPLPTVSGNLPA